MSGRLENKHAIVTGGAQGIGLAITKRFAAEGAQVIIADVNADEGPKVAADIPGAAFHPLDVTSEESWQALFADAEKQLGRIDILVNNAGIARMADIEHTTLADWQAVIAVNLTGNFLGNKYGVIHMKDHGGAIVNMSSIAGLVGDPNSAAYTASKGGVRLLTKSVASYCAEQHYNIRVNSVHPGIVATPMVAGIPKEIVAKVAAQNPMGRIAQPEEIANMVLFVASDEASYSTGSEFIVDGGTTAQ